MDPNQTVGYRKMIWNVDELIKEFLMEHIDLITTDKPNATIIITAEQPDGEHGDHEKDGSISYDQENTHNSDNRQKCGYYEHELPQYTKLFNKYWDINWYNENVEQNGGEESLTAVGMPALRRG